MSKHLDTLKFLRGLLIFLILISIGAVIISFFTEEKNVYTVTIILLVVSIIVTILSIFGIVKLNKKIKTQDLEIEKHNEIANGYLKVCWQTMAKLNASYDWSISSDLMEMTTPLIDLDHYFDVNKFEYLHEKYGLEDCTNPNQSTNYVLSGQINGNPFVLVNSFNTRMSTKTYSGSIVIHWTTTETDSKGQMRTVHHSETLIATVDKPAPIYYYDTRLIYGNDAAGNLEFSRKPVLRSDLDEKDIDRMVRKGEKKLQKMTEKAVSKGKQFNAMANSKFEVLFNALDRTNELEYRLMFTPLAQNNMIDLIQNNPYGDDFCFFKDKNLNYIISSHSQRQDYKIDPNNFEDYDIDSAKTKFIDINSNFFRGLYFDLAPLLSIPLYQQTKTHEYIYKIPYEAYNTKFEQESLANRLNKRILVAEDSKTDAILKCSFNHKDKDTDYITVRAHSYRTEPRVDYVNRIGGDGHIHTIPVHWEEYIPVFKDTDIAMTNVNTTRYKFNNSNELINKLASEKTLVYERGLLSYIIGESASIKDIKDKINKNKEKE